MAGVVFTLERLNWRSAGREWLCLPGADRLESFADRADAETMLRDREWELRRRINPFRCGGPFLHYQTTFDAARLHDWFLDAGLDPPGPTADSQAWAAVWDRDYPAMTHAQSAVAWEALDRVRFFRIGAGPPGDSFHLVVRPHFEQDPIVDPYRWQERPVGGTPYMLVRHRSTADDLCHQLFVDSIRAYLRPGDTAPAWEQPERDPFAGEEAVAADPYVRGPTYYAEHRPLELFGNGRPTPGQTKYVVLRRHWRLVSSDDFWRWCLTEAKSCGHAVAAFDTLAAADAFIAELEVEARTGPSPFRFGPPHEWGILDAGRIWGVLSEMFPINFASQWTDYTATDQLWNRWWDDAVTTMSADDIALTWSLYDRLRFYEVVAVEYRD